MHCSKYECWSSHPSVTCYCYSLVYCFAERFAFCWRTFRFRGFTGKITTLSLSRQELRKFLTVSYSMRTSNIARDKYIYITKLGKHYIQIQATAPVGRSTSSMAGNTYLYTSPNWGNTYIQSWGTPTSRIKEHWEVPGTAIWSPQFEGLRQCIHSMGETWVPSKGVLLLLLSCRLAGSHQLTRKYAALAIVLNVHISSRKSQNVHWSLGTGQVPKAQQVLWLIPVHVIYSLNCWFSRPTCSIPASQQFGM